MTIPPAKTNFLDLPAAGGGGGVGGGGEGTSKSFLTIAVSNKVGGCGEVSWPFPEIAASNAVMTAPQVWKRFAGSFSKHLSTTCSTAGGTPGVRQTSGGGGVRTWRS